MALLHRLIRKHDPATLFLCIATLVVTIELIIMRTFVPFEFSTEENGSQALMEQVCTSENLDEATIELEVWGEQAICLSRRLVRAPSQWQKKLDSKFAFGKTVGKITSANDNPRYQYLAAANYAENNLLLQSIMTGRTMLANINGSIYKVGDNVSLREGEIVMNIVEVGSTYVVVQLVEHDYKGDTQRTIYLANSPKLASGERTP